VSLAARIDALLPQTQCTRCGYPDCRAYAEALARGEADLDRCPPGGEATIEALSRLTGRAPKALDAACGAPGPRRAARIDERWCIGCTLCIAACPVDAIIGGAKRMHTVVERLCTGCELCLAPCPTDCIEMVPAASGPGSAQGWLRERAGEARARYLERRARLGAARERAAQRREARRARSASRQAVIDEAVARVRARRAARGT